MTAVEVFAPAKINLTLHVTRRREDGYHELDTLVAFADTGDRLEIRDVTRIAAPGARGTLVVSGLESADVPEGGDNLVARAIDMMVEDVAPWVHLEKTLPIAAGLGGGSSDAAAAIRAVALAWNMDLARLSARGTLSSLARNLGADVPMCLDPRPARARGIGEALEPVDLPELDAILVNPRVAVPTGAVFAALETRTGAPMDWPPATGSVPDFCDWLAAMRNDLEAPARTVAPVIGRLLDRLGALSGVRLARMSGSGATCFAIFDGAEAAAQAADVMRWEQPDWWVRQVKLGDMSARAAPREVVS